MRKYLLLFLLLPFLGLTQVSSVSPYSLYGVGDVNGSYFLKNTSMGGTGIALRDPIFMNMVNPASYTELELTTLEVAVSHKFLRQIDQANNFKVENQLTYFQYFGLGFKITDKWGIGLSLNPYSNVGYNIFTQETNPDFGKTKYVFEGDGGIDQFVLGTAYEPVKNLSVGVNARYLFGSTDKSSAAEFEDVTFLNSKRNTRLRVADFKFDFGAQYIQSLSEKYDLTIGATYASQANIKSYRSLTDYNYKIVGGSDKPLDTTSYISNQKGSITLPSQLGFGLTFGRKNKDIYSYSWLIAADFTQTAWSQYKSFEGNQNLKDAFRASIGTYFIPGFAFNQKTGRKSYLSQVEWRIGGFYESTGITIDQSEVFAKGVSLGWSFPLKPRNLAPGDAKLNNFSFGIEVGNKGANNKNVIKEEYINLTFGITLNDLWFQERKYR